MQKARGVNSDPIPGFIFQVFSGKGNKTLVLPPIIVPVAELEPGRRVLVESAWTYKYHARVTLPLIKRQRDLPKSICQISGKAKLRLCARYRMMIARKKPAQVVAVAIARELAAFMWAIAKEVEATA